MTHEDAVEPEPFTLWPTEHHEDLLAALRVVDAMRARGELTEERMQRARTRPLPDFAMQADLVHLVTQDPDHRVPGRRVLEKRWGVSEFRVRKVLQDPRWREQLEGLGVPFVRHQQPVNKPTDEDPVRDLRILLADVDASSTALNASLGIRACPECSRLLGDAETGPLCMRCKADELRG